MLPHKRLLSHCLHPWHGWELGHDEHTKPTSKVQELSLWISSSPDKRMTCTAPLGPGWPRDSLQPCTFTCRVARESAAFLAKWNLMWFRSRRQRGKDSFFGQTFPSFGYFVWEILGSKAGWLMELSIDLNHQVPPCQALSDYMQLLKPGWCHPKTGASNSPSSSKPT